LLALHRAPRLERVFCIEINRCARWNVQLKVLARIEDTAVIARILAHLQRASGTVESELGRVRRAGVA
jgi:hypothetical protein